MPKKTASAAAFLPIELQLVSCYTTFLRWYIKTSLPCERGVCVSPALLAWIQREGTLDLQLNSDFKNQQHTQWYDLLTSNHLPQYDTLVTPFFTHWQGQNFTILRGHRLLFFRFWGLFWELNGGLISQTDLERPFIPSKHLSKLTHPQKQSQHINHLLL